MKKISVLTLGLLLAAGPAFADAGVNQSSWGNSIGNTWDNSYSYSGNEGVSNANISNASGILGQNINAGAASNVGAATDVAVSGGLVTSGGSVWAGQQNDNSGIMSNAYLQQVSAYNIIGDAQGQSNSPVYSLGVGNVSINGSTGIVSQNINAGVASNVGDAKGVTIR